MLSDSPLFPQFDWLLMLPLLLVAHPPLPFLLHFSLLLVALVVVLVVVDRTKSPHHHSHRHHTKKHTSFSVPAKPNLRSIFFEVAMLQYIDVQFGSVEEFHEFLYRKLCRGLNADDSWRRFYCSLSIHPPRNDWRLVFWRSQSPNQVDSYFLNGKKS